MSEEIKKEVQDAEINQEDLNQAAGGGFFDVIPLGNLFSVFNFSNKNHRHSFVAI